MDQSVAGTSPRRDTYTRSWFWSLVHIDTTKQRFIANPRIRIFLISFAMLFFELLCIRWIPSYVRYLSYFNNFLLLAAFLGMGLGILAARRQRFWFPPFPLMLLILTIIVAVNRFDLHIDSTELLYYGAAETQSAQAENFYVLPLIFGLVAACFIPLGRAFGQLITQARPLTAYTFDIIGSLVGIALFSIIAYFALPPIFWFGFLAVPVLLLCNKRTVLPTALLMLISLGIAWQLQLGAFWSPYYKILLQPAKPSGYVVDVNNVGHQTMVPWQYKEPFYRLVYQLFPGKTFHSALILGAGSGSDVSTALAHGVQSITAVEIDPTILQLGVRYNPDHPYSNPRVKTVVDDGRAFLQNTTGRYDLIIFALPDSLTLTSSNANLRLESFLLTQDALAAARSHLTRNGLVVLYNYYREQWLVEKLADMAGHAFNQQPLVSTYGGWGRAAIIMVGPRLATLPPGTYGPYHEIPVKGNQRLRVIGAGYFPLTSITPATDDWPFLYLQDRSFPLLYVAGLAMVLLFALGGTLALAPRRVLRRFDWHMFFLGVAFMLLEVKSLTTFSLLFGSTWLVNSLVFFAILSSVLLAVLVNHRFKIRRIRLFYVLLFGILALNLLLPPEALLLNNPLLRYLLASALAFTPVFLANIIFANSFRDSETADIAFASNLLGIMIGGGLEYFSMLTGYRLLLIPVIVFYACALLLWRRHKASAGELATPS
ncbi:MAG TPA: hypothetical protein VFQ30_03285 [Ktedonobacteraceae bacterium]|nr:hypothetical protein [Ktedonobacteraceae bacterium]